jgi:hypothetical protein
MAMPGSQADADNLNPLTRAGQVGAAGNTGTPGGSGAPMDCQPASHG